MPPHIPGKKVLTSPPPQAPPHLPIGSLPPKPPIINPQLLEFIEQSSKVSAGITATTTVLGIFGTGVACAGYSFTGTEQKVSPFDPLYLQHVANSYFGDRIIPLPNKSPSAASVPCYNIDPSEKKKFNVVWEYLVKK